MGVKIGSVDRWSLPLHQLSCSFYFERRASFYSVQPVARGIPGEMKTTAATTHASKSSGQQQKKTLSVCADLIKRTYSPRGIPFRSSLDVISSTVSKWNECVPDTMRYRCAIFNPRARGRKIHGNRVCCCYYLFPFFFLLEWRPWCTSIFHPTSRVERFKGETVRIYLCDCALQCRGGHLYDILLPPTASLTARRLIVWF